MAKKNDLQATVKKIDKPLVKLQSLFNDVIDNLSSSNTTKRDRELKQLTSEIDDVIFQEIESLTKFTGDDISTFLVKLFNDYDNNSGPAPFQNIEDIFSNESSGVFSFFQDRYRNQNLLYEDLGLISSQLFELKEALNATRDAIVTSDDVSQNVSRSLKFKNSSQEDTTRKSFVAAIESMENRFKLLSRIKNHIIPNTLQYGKYYVYTIPYAKMFEQHYKQKVKDEMKLRTTLESFDEDALKVFKDEVGIDPKVPVKKMKESFSNVMENIEVYNDDYAIPVMEGVELDDLVAAKFDKNVEQAIKQQSKRKKNMSGIGADGTVEMNAKDQDFSNIKDCYVKLIDPRKIIPIKIMDETIGYYYVHQTDLQVSKSPFTTTIKLGQQANKKDVETAFLTKITDKVVKSFNRKFLESNAQFKDLILNALIYNDVYKKQLKFQFIPVDYITEFAVNLDEDNNGTSILLPSLFNAKLYLALLIFKMITIISKSNDQKVYYVKNSGIDQNVSNKVQEIARSIKDRQINFMDLLNYNSMVSKIGQAKDIFMPVGRSGEKGIEFDILAGQDVQLNTELMEMLRTAFINATGVPSVIMNYVNEADYAKTLVMANNKFVGRVVNFQLDFNEGLTKLYQKLMKFSTDVPEENIAEFEFVLSPPKSLNTMNMTDLINNADQVIAFMIKAQTGEQANQSEDDNKRKDLLYKHFAELVLPMLPWGEAQKIYEEVELELKKWKAQQPNDDQS